jgi:DNA replication initiation complex subunit (GINS family)
MKTSKLIESCIEELKKMLGDANNELTSGQREELTDCIRELKRLQRATRLTHQEVYLVVARIAQAAHQLLEVGVSA